MPSRMVDIAWHEFIIFTRAYADFSSKATGRFLHLPPTEAMQSPVSAQEEKNGHADWPVQTKISTLNIHLAYPCCLLWIPCSTSSTVFTIQETAEETRPGKSLANTLLAI